ncbi:unnamed protein product [marine sediment metagenome]|uniref:Uncharacterized protein n=1 Tax=marine sediment metagenome TaxID=412755 RepID=X0V831_9ZZZZ
MSDHVKCLDPTPRLIFAGILFSILAGCVLIAKATASPRPPHQTEHKFHVEELDRDFVVFRVPGTDIWCVTPDSKFGGIDCR